LLEDGQAEHLHSLKPGSPPTMKKRRSTTARTKVQKPNKKNKSQILRRWMQPQETINKRWWVRPNQLQAVPAKTRSKWLPRPPLLNKSQLPNRSPFRPVFSQVPGAMGTLIRASMESDRYWLPLGSALSATTQCSSITSLYTKR
jgi:hypothetical protein